MLLVSYEFGAFCLALVVLYYLIPGRFQWILLLAASYLFYACGGASYVLYPLITTVTTWFLARQIGAMTARSRAYIREKKPDRMQKKAHNQAVKRKQRRLLLVGLCLNFGILAVLKYTDFVLENVGAALNLAGVSGGMEGTGWLLPLGISYYTFQSMGYLIDVYWRKYEPEENPARFALFVSFFPQLTAGPISRFDAMRGQLFAAHPFEIARIRSGLFRILWGYCKKLVVADRIGPAASMITDAPELYGGIYVFFGILGHVIQLYADFSGGMDIVLGIAELFGITLPENFRRPFFAKSLAEFWRRWHITLMEWLREYIFFPVSTSRAGKRLSALAGRLGGKTAAGKAPVWLAGLTVWLVTGLWHGASWRWIAWGLANGLILLISQEFSGTFQAMHKRFAFMRTAGYRYFQMLRTFLLFCFTWLFVYYPISLVPAALAEIFSGRGLWELLSGGYAEFFGTAELFVLLLGLALMGGADVLGRRESVRERLARAPFVLQYLALFALFLLVLIAGEYGQGYDASQFIYNRF